MRFWPWQPASKSTTPMSSATLAQLLARVFGGGATKSGATVNWQTSLQVTAADHGLDRQRLQAPHNGGAPRQQRTFVGIERQLVALGP